MDAGCLADNCCPLTVHLWPRPHMQISPSQIELEAPDGAADRENRPRGFRTRAGDVPSPCTFTGNALTKAGPIRTRCSHLDHLATFHLHQLTEVLLQQAGVGAPLQQAQQIHWEEKERNVDMLKQKRQLLLPLFQLHLYTRGEIIRSSFQQMTSQSLPGCSSRTLQSRARRSSLRFKAQLHVATARGSINHCLHLHRYR